MKTKSHSLLLLALIGATVLLACLVGCGGSGEPSSTKPRSAAAKPQPPVEKARPPKRSPAEQARFIKEKARFVRQGNAICKRADAGQHKRAIRYLKREGPLDRKWELVKPAVVPPMERELQGLRALKPPEGGEAEIRRILEKLEKGVKDANYDPIDLVYTWSDPFQGGRHLAKRYGLTVCAFSSQVIIQPREEKNGF